MEEEDSIVGLWTQQLVRVGRWKFKGMDGKETSGTEDSTRGVRGPDSASLLLPLRVSAMITSLYDVILPHWDGYLLN